MWFALLLLVSAPAEARRPTIDSFAIEVTYSDSAPRPEPEVVWRSRFAGRCTLNGVPVPPSGAIALPFAGAGPDRLRLVCDGAESEVALYRGEVNERTLGELDGATVIVGDLRLGEMSGTDVAGLAGVTTISGTLDLSGRTELRSLAGLSALDAVGGDLVLRRLPALPSLEGLGALRVVGGDLDVDETAVTSMDGLQALIAVGGLLVRDNRYLGNVQGLISLTFARDFVEFTANPLLTDFRGLSKLRYTNFLAITRQDSVDAIVGFDSLERVGALYVRDNGELTEVGAFPALTHAGVVELGSNTKLTHLRGLEAQRTVSNTLKISSSPELLDLRGLGGVTEVGELELVGLSGLQSLRGLEGLSRLGSLLLFDDSSLADIRALSGVRTLSGNLSLYGLPALGSLEGLENVETVSGYLQLNGLGIAHVAPLSKLTRAEDGLSIRRNSRLANLDGLGALVYVGTYVAFSENPSLPCSAARALIQELESPPKRIEFHNCP